METMGLRSCNEIFNYLSYLMRKTKELETELDELGRISILPSKHRRKREIKERLAFFDEDIDKYVEFFEEATTFERNMLSSYFARFFNMLYGMNYSVQINIKDTTETKYCISTDLIASNRDFAKIDKRYDFSKPVRVKNIIRTCQDTCLAIGGPSDYTLLDNCFFSKAILRFPEIAEYISTLVDLKLAEPDMSDEKRLAVALKIAVTKLKTRKEEAERQVGENIVLEDGSEEMEPENMNTDLVEQGSQENLEAPHILRKSLNHENMQYCYGKSC